MNDSVFCEVMKTQTFITSDGPNLEEKLRHSNGSDKFGKVEKNLNCLLGNGKNGIFTISDITNKLFIRNNPELVSFDDKGKLVIFVPEWYISKAIKCIDPSCICTLQDYSMELTSNPNLCPERRKYFEDLKLFNYYVGGHRVHRGETPERNL